MGLEFKFTGLEAKRHQIAANEGFESLSGLAHAATLVAHFTVTGVVRQRQPYDDGLRLFFQDTRPGSLEVVLAVGGSLAMGAAGNLFYDLLKNVWKRATGTGAKGDLEIGGVSYREGDLEALAEAISPSLLRGHSWLAHPEQNISIKTGHQIIVDLNKETKDYLKEEVVEEGDSLQDVSVAALNANSKYGRVFFFDVGRTVPFKVDKNASFRTIPNLSRYLTEYVDNTGATVNIKFKKVLYRDGRLKRIIISDCYGIKGAA